MPSASRRRSEAGTNTARRLTCFVPASLRDYSRTSFRAIQPAILTDWNAVFQPAPAQPGIAADRFARKIVRILM
jgi:hypothetical protein